MAAGRGGSIPHWLPQAFGHLSFAIARAVGSYPGILYRHLGIQRGAQKDDHTLIMFQTGNTYYLFWNRKTFS